MRAVSRVQLKKLESAAAAGIASVCFVGTSCETSEPEESAWSGQEIEADENRDRVRNEFKALARDWPRSYNTYIYIYIHTYIYIYIYIYVCMYK